MSKFKSIFFNGLKLIVPIVFTILLVFWLFDLLEELFKSFLLLFIEPSWYFKGLGWISGIVLTFLMGLLIQIPYFGNKAEALKRQFLRLPVIKTIYQTFSDLVGFLTDKKISQGKIVKIDTPLGDVLGILTQDDLDSVHKGIGGKDEVAVYIPMSYQIGGYTVLVPKDSVNEIDMTVQEGMALTMTAYISGKKQDAPEM